MLLKEKESWEIWKNGDIKNGFEIMGVPENKVHERKTNSK